MLLWLISCCRDLLKASILFTVGYSSYWKLSMSSHELVQFADYAVLRSEGTLLKKMSLPLVTGLQSVGKTEH